MSELSSKSFKLSVLASSEPAKSGKGLSRRGFLQVLGATSVATLAAGCTRPDQDTVKPFVQPVDDVVPGNPLHYATAMCTGGIATPLMVTAYEGRPTKIEGNPNHPHTEGATGPFEQAATLSLYDPSRARDIRHKGVGTSREALFAHLRQKAAAFAKDGGKGLRLLLEPSSSPLLGEQLARLKQKFPASVVRFYSAASSDFGNQGAQLAFGRPVRAVPQFKSVKVVLSLDSDFLTATAENLRLNADYADRRFERENVIRHYQLEADHTLTGSNADHRFPMKTSEVAVAARAFGAALAGTGGDATPPASLGQKAFDAIVKDLRAAGASALVLAGERQPAAVHALAHAINGALGAVGKSVNYVASPLLDANTGSASLKALADEVNAGGVDTVICNVFDPEYAHPSDIDVAQLVSKTPNFIYTAMHLDHTAEHATWFVPAPHFLETWGDARTADGTITVVQPLIQPLYNSLTIEELLSGLLDPAPRTAHDLMRERYRTLAGANDPDAFWRKLLRQGFVEDSAPKGGEAAPSVNAGAVKAAVGSIAAIAGIELNLRNDYRTWDGRHARNPWLLEMPDPVTKLVWDNAAYLSDKTAEKLGLDLEHVVSITANGKTVEAPILVVPGHADDAITLTLGWGATDPQSVIVDHDPVNLGYAEDQIGVDAYPLLTTAGYATEAKVSATGKRYPLAITQGAFTQDGRDLAMTVDVSSDKSREEGLKRVEELKSDKLQSMYEPYEYTGFKWAMGVDLARCTGCSACVVACVSENNIPMVGKDGVRRGREMHWLRIDRYYEDNPKNPASPRVVSQPVACVHCENAPCEYVCPVNATVHNEEGLNEMVYNRCVGTRYCSNNCPYKVRRFNFFAYNNEVSPLEAMGKNPNVTVRSRGVMEKCTYCVQRIEAARIGSEIQGLAGNDGKAMIRVLGTAAPTDPAMAARAAKVPVLQTACQQACPTDAIIFGNLNDKDSVAARMHADERRFDLLVSLGTRPRTGYLARLINRNPELA